ncbi:MAG: SpoIID/LytB domain-containing protein, partial [Candidatus Atribacteria bacterium]|nr:SpoIID/LytB domain-containing protein [Candidatus Atribacteria bacterium]
ENSENVWGGYEPYLRSVPSTYEDKASPPNHFWDYSLTEQELMTKLIKKGYQMSQIDNVVISEKTETGRVKSVDILFDHYQKINFKVNDFRLFIGPTLIRSSLFDVYKIGGNIEQKKVLNSQPEKENKVIQKSVHDILEEEKDLSIAELIQLLNRPEEKRQEKEQDSLTQPQIKETEEHSETVYTFKGSGNGHGVGLSQWGAYGMALQGYDYEEILKYYYQGIQLTKLYE